ncbi:MAG: aminodeoxychorismate synthase component I [bacterium]|nr:aminodeoxychorismate synthase component I [bacterium]
MKLNRDQLREELNRLGSARTPFLFVIDYNMEKCHIQPLESLDKDILFDIDGVTNVKSAVAEQASSIKITRKDPVSPEVYGRAFETVISEIKKGNTYLLNLTFPTEIELNASLQEIFSVTRAPFKLCYKDDFVCFSPERFVKIENDVIKTYPMKGTIDASIPGAKEIILNNKKEMAEHVMVVDLLRNDLSIIAQKVRLKKFRYVDKIKAGNKELLQVSSEITGKLEESWQDHIGDILLPMLPAGSITGAPKKKTVEIINSVEQKAPAYNRGFYTGIFGIFNGSSLDSAVMIRFIERAKDKRFIYKSGGGITIDSDMEMEYAEMIDKVYVPV